MEPSVTHIIDLEPQDWFWATWRQLPPLVRPVVEKAPFDLNLCLKRLRRIPVFGPGRRDFLPNLSEQAGREEAHFWLTVLSEAPLYKEAAGLADKLQDRSFTGWLTVEEVARRGKTIALAPPLLLFPAVHRLLAPPQIVELMLTGFCWHWPPDSLYWLAQEVMPYLTQQERLGLLPAVRDQLARSQWPSDHYKRPDPSFFLAAMLGLHREVLGVVNGIADDFYNRDRWDNDGGHQPQLLVFGLDSPGLMEHHMKRLGLRIKNRAFLRAWLAHTETSALDHVRDSILTETNNTEVRRLIEDLMRVRAPEAAEPMLAFKLASKAPDRAREWLEGEIGNAIAGLIPIAAGRGTLAEGAVEFLRQARRNGQSAFIEEQLKLAAPAVAERVRKTVLDDAEKIYQPLEDTQTPEWLLAALSGAKKPAKLPRWLDPGSLPALPIAGDTRLNDAQILALLAALKNSPLGAPDVLLKVLRQRFDPAALDDFGWKLFEVWQSEGAPPGEKWMMTAVGHLGSDASALRLTPLVRKWPGEHQQKRAVIGLECLCAIGTDTALMQLNGIAQKVRFKGLQNKAREMMNAIAQVLGLSRAQLEDRIVPDLDLDKRGSRVLDFGPRKFTVVLGPDLVPLVRDEAGKLKRDPPKPGLKDDAEKARPALAVWKLLKKQLREVAKLQAARLEQAMVARRRWSVEEFESLLVRHPLMILLVRRLLWSGLDAQGKPAVVFRVTEEREYADVRDATATLQGLIGVSLVHPLHLTAEQRAAWGEVFGDYELIAPFPQLGRSIYHLDPGEEKEKQITRFKKQRIPGVSLMSLLESHGWERGTMYDRGEFYKHVRFFPTGNVTAVIEYEPGLRASDITSTEGQSITCCFLPGPDRPVGRIDPAQTVVLGEVDEIVLSEVLAELHALASKAT